MQIALFDGPQRKGLLPLVYARPVADLLVGTSTVKEKWEVETGKEVKFAPDESLVAKFGVPHEDDTLYIYGGLIPSAKIITATLALPKNTALIYDNLLLAYRGDASSEAAINKGTLKAQKRIQLSDEPIILLRPYHLFKYNEYIIQEDIIRFGLAQNVSNQAMESNRFIGDGFYIHPDAKVNAATLNASTGPIIIEEGAEVMEGAVIRGPFVLKAHGTVKMSAKIYGATTVGKHSKVGGEVGNSIIDNYSNKGHDGYMGNSVIGQWCNLGADTNTSNLKNNYGNVSSWSYEKDKLENTGEQFVGLTMGDHAKCSINTMFNTGTVIGMCANIFQAGFPEKFVPSFAWGGEKPFTPFNLEKAFEMAQRMMERRGIDFTKEDEAIFEYVSQSDRQYF